METPREELKRLSVLNGDSGYYGTHNQFVVLIESRLYEKATNIMNSLNTSVLWSNERAVHNQIYDYLLDGITIKEIKSKFICS